jgi:glycosyltransferase involved in cell wall biosynthesis
MKTLIVDPAIHSRGGHHYAAIDRLQSEFSRLGIEAACLGSAAATPDIACDLACSPTFASPVYGRDYSGPKEFDLRVARTSRELSRALQRMGTWPDILVLPCCDQVLAAAVARVLRRHPLKPPPQVLAWLLYGPHHQLAPDNPAAIPFHGEARRAFTALLKAVGGRQKLTAYCETEAMAAFYRKLLPFDVEVAPGAGIALRDASGASPPDAAERPRLTVAGFANRSKGYRLLPDAIPQLLQRHATSRFTVHGIVAGSDAEDDAWIFDSLERLGPRVDIRRDVLSDEDYLDLLARTDLLLLPYDPEAYRVRGSAISNQARRLGIPIVAPADCAFAWPAFDDGYGVAMSSYSPDGLAEATVEALGRLDALKAQASAISATTKDRLGGILEATMEAASTRPRQATADALQRLLGLAL